MDRHELQKRLIDFAVLIVKIANEMPESAAGKHFSGQLIRSGTSPAFHYGEAQSAESKKDFVHKLSIALKELRETFVNLIIIHRTGCYKHESDVIAAKIECNELISIFVRSIQTVKKNP